jgi:hypothetical protein
MSNVDGAEKRPAMVIGKMKKPQVFSNKAGDQLGFYYCSNAKAWMTTILYQEWVQEWDRELAAKRRNILLLHHNFARHIVPAGIQNINVENFVPNLTEHVQSKEQGII